MEARHCKLCNRAVVPIKRLGGYFWFGLIAFCFLFWFIVGPLSIIVTLVISVIIALARPKVCPICNSSDLSTENVLDRFFDDLEEKANANRDKFWAKFFTSNPPK